MALRSALNCLARRHLDMRVGSAATGIGGVSVLDPFRAIELGRRGLSHLQDLVDGHLLMYPHRGVLAQDLL